MTTSTNDDWIIAPITRTGALWNSASMSCISVFMSLVPPVSVLLSVDNFAEAGHLSNHVGCLCIDDVIKDIMYSMTSAQWLIPPSTAVIRISVPSMMCLRGCSLHSP